MKKRYYPIGITWDEYTSGVEGNLVRDLLTLQAECSKWPGNELQVVCMEDNADKMLRVLRIPRLELPTLPGVWIMYQATEDRPRLPEGVNYQVKKIERILHQGKNTIRLVKGMDGGMALGEQGRDNTYDPFSRQPTTTTNWSTTDPLVTLVWS